MLKRFRVGGKGEMHHGNIDNCAQTAARIRKYDDEEHSDDDPKMQGQTNMQSIMYFASCLCLFLMKMVVRLVARCSVI